MKSRIDHVLAAVQSAAREALGTTERPCVSPEDLIALCYTVKELQRAVGAAQGRPDCGRPGWGYNPGSGRWSRKEGDALLLAEVVHGQVVWNVYVKGVPWLTNSPVVSNFIEAMRDADERWETRKE